MVAQDVINAYSFFSEGLVSKIDVYLQIFLLLKKIIAAYISRSYSDAD